jgi:hypothetical protein
MVELYLHPPQVLMAWCLLIKHRDNFAFYLLDHLKRWRSSDICGTTPVSRNCIHEEIRVGSIRVMLAVIQFRTFVFLSAI